MRSFSVSPQRVDVTQGGSTELAFDALISDDLSGLADWSVALRRPEDGQFWLFFSEFFPRSLEEDHQTRNSFPGVARPDGSPLPPGTYEFSVGIADAAGYFRVYSSSELAAAGFTPSIYNGP